MYFCTVSALPNLTYYLTMKRSQTLLPYAAACLLCTACNSDEEIALPPAPASADYTTLYEYTPAPGQFINDTQLSGFEGEQSPEAALAYAERRLRAGQWISLGGWGGYVVAGFDEPVANDGGFNLLIEGNDFATSSEPGIVWVMRDENGNGLPDDTWYELPGSEAARSIRNYEVTYRRPASDSVPVAWSDNQGNSGTLDRTSEHPQAYYPAWIQDNGYTLRGTLLPANLEERDGLWVAAPFDWGYADNFAAHNRNLFRISDAVDADGAPVVLPVIHFVKIQTGVNAQAPGLGEISTEIRRICNYNLLK